MPGLLSLNPAQNAAVGELITPPVPTPEKDITAPVPVAQPGQPDQTVDQTQQPQQVLSPEQQQQSSNYNANAHVVEAFNNFVRNGGDVSKLTQDELDGVAQGAKALPPIEHPETDPARFYALYKDGKYASGGILGLAEDFGTGLLNTIGLVAKEGSKQVFNWWAQTAGVGGLGPTHLDQYTDYQAKQASAVVQATQSNWDTYTKRLPAGINDIFNGMEIDSQRMGETDPNKLAQLDFKQAEIIRQKELREAGYQKNMTDARNAVADIYAKVGLDDYSQRLLKANPSPDTIQFMGLVTDPTNLLSFGAEELAASAFKTGVRTTRLAEAGAALAKMDEKMTSTALARTTMESILDSNVPLTTTARSGYESSLARIRTVQDNLAADRAAAQAEHQAALANVSDQMTKAAQANPVRQATGLLLQAGGQAAEAVGKFTEAVAKIPEAIVQRIMPTADEATKAAAASGIRSAGTDMSWAQRGLSAATMGAGAAVGGPVGAVVGAVAPAFTRISGSALRNFGHDLATIGQQYAMGQQTLPFWRNIAERTTGMTSWAASKLDNNLVYSIPKLTTGAAMGAGISGGMGYLTSGGDPRAAAQAAGGGAFFGAAGAGLGQLGNFRNLGELRQAAIGDRSRFLQAISPTSGRLFNQLHPEHQLALSVYAMAHPDVDIHFFHDPNESNGWWTPNNPRGSIHINVAGDNPVHAIIAHEIAHHLANHALGQTAADYVMGNPATGQIGITTAIGPDGKPMTETDPRTGQASYVQTKQLEDFKAQYNARKVRDNPRATAEDNYGIAQEFFADLHAQYLSNPETLQKLVRGHIPSDLVSENAVNNLLTKLGFGADPTTGNPISTSSLQGARGLVDLVNNYYKQRQYKQWPIDTDRGQTKVPVGDVVKGTPEFDRVQKNFEASGDLVRNPDGSIKTDLAGRPIVKTPRQADLDHAELGKDVLAVYQKQPALEGAPGDNLLKTVTDRDGRQFLRGQVVPDSVLDEITALNKHNSNQIINWRKMNGIMARNDGTMTLGVYNTASQGRGRYATLPARERSLVPIWTEVSLHTNQVNMKAYDPQQLQANVAKMLRSKKGKELWDGHMPPAIDDVRTYMDNLANGRPGETGIGMDKKGVINELFGFNADANPYASDLARRSPSVIKSFRIDRMNRISEVPTQREPFREATYEQVRSFMQPRKEPVLAASPDESTIPVTTRTTSTGKTVRAQKKTPKLAATP